MFSPQFTLTAKLAQNLMQIERLYGQLEAWQIPRQLELNLERNNLIKSSYISNSIAGNPLSFAQVTNLLTGRRAPSGRDEREGHNYFALLKRLPRSVALPLRLSTALRLHETLLTGVNDSIAGQIRDKRVIVGGYKAVQGKTRLIVKHEPPFHSRRQIENQLRELLEWFEKDTKLSSLVRVGLFHHRYVFLHPFADGNGRTCRLLTALVLLKLGYRINRYFVLDDYYDLDRVKYSDMLNSADQGDATAWLTYFTDGVKFSLKSALERVKQAVLYLEASERPTNRERVVLEFLTQNLQLISADVVAKFGVSRQQAHKLLTGLVRKGLATKKGSTKNSYYVPKA